ncbi:MAG: Glucose-1-phosphate thymidylyltransferase 2 [bacterium ADurb.Bin236]|nr:MAG: Glucose-1-phosphate thymidylyltransferase 2 [bacterium ADurb.Bin236]HPN93138.1 glucose-1-phosphate thymidylyltransferase [bacterium]
MKGLILSGGRGTRLRPLTYTRAKQLIPVANKPILFYGIEAIVKAGINEIGIIVGDTKEEVKAAAGDGSRFGCKITYIEQDEPLGLAHAVMVAEPFLKDDRFVMYLGDNIIRDGINELVGQFIENKPNSQILLARVSNPSQFGVAELNGNLIVRLEEKPKKPRSDLALVGVYMFDSNVFKAVHSIKPSWRGELEITDAISWLIEKGYAVEPYIIKGWWKDTGKLEDLLEANRIILDMIDCECKVKLEGGSRLEGKVAVEEGAVIENSVVRGPAVIGAGANVSNSYIGPFTSVGPGAKVVNSEIEHSILLDDSEVSDIAGRITDSLIGRAAKVTRSAGTPRALSFMLGDQSEATLL